MVRAMRILRTPTVMWKYRHRTRKDYAQSYSSATLLESTFAHPNWDPPVSRFVTSTFASPEYLVLDERLVDVIERDKVPLEQKKGEWKPIAHYKRYTAYPNEAPESVVSRMGRGGQESDLGSDTSKTRIAWLSPSTIAYGNYKEVIPLTDPLILASNPVFVSYFGLFGQHLQGVPEMVTTTNWEDFEYETYYDSPRARELMDWIPKPSNFNDLAIAAFRRCLPNTSNELSILNTLFEWREIRDLRSSTMRSISSFDRLSQLLPEKVKHLKVAVAANTALKLPKRIKLLRKTFLLTGGSTLAEVSKTAANTHLLTQFGILPLMRDVVAIDKSLRKLREKLYTFIHNQGELQRRDCTLNWLPMELTCDDRVQNAQCDTGQFADRHETVPFPDLTGAFRKYSGALNYRRFVIVNPATFHLQLEYTYSFTKLQQKYAFALALLDDLGIQMNPRIIWDAIPWSFVIDWIAKVGSLLDTMGEGNMKPEIRVTRCMWSVKYSRRIRTTVKSYQDAGTFPTPVYLPDMYESAYRRSHIGPQIQTLLMGSGVSSHEFTLGTALAISKFRMPKSRL